VGFHVGGIWQKKLMFFNIINDIFEKLAKPQVFSSVFLCLVSVIVCRQLLSAE